MTTARHVLFARPALITATLLLLALPAHSQPGAAGDSKAPPAPAVAERLDQLLFAYQRLSFDLGRLADEARVSGRIDLDLEGFTYEILLQPNDLRAYGMKRILTTPEGVVEEAPPPLGTYLGTVAGEADSDVRLIIQPDLFAGYVRIGKRLFFVEPLAKFASGVPFDQLVVYSQDDVRAEARGVCGLDARRGTVTQLLDKSLEGEPPTNQPTEQVEKRREQGLELATAAEVRKHDERREAAFHGREVAGSLGPGDQEAVAGRRSVGVSEPQLTEPAMQRLSIHVAAHGEHGLVASTVVDGQQASSRRAELSREP